MHFPTDILGGWIFGLGLFLVTIYLMPKIEKKLKKATIYRLLALHLFVTLTLIYSSSLHNNYSYTGCSIGFALGLFLCHKFKVNLPQARGAKEYVVRAIFGVAGVFFLCMALPIPILIRTFLASLWVSFFAPILLGKKALLKRLP